MAFMYFLSYVDLKSTQLNLFSALDLRNKAIDVIWFEIPTIFLYQ